MFVKKFFNGKRKSDNSNRIKTFNLIDEKRHKYLEGGIIIGHCSGRNTITIFFFCSKDFISSMFDFYLKIIIFASHGLLLFL